MIARPLLSTHLLRMRLRVGMLLLLFLLVQHGLRVHHQPIRIVGVHRLEIAWVLPTRCGDGRGRRSSPLPRIIEASTPGKHVIRTPLDDLLQHPPCQFDPGSLSLDVDLAGCLIDLYVARRPTLEVVDGDAAPSNDVTDVGPLAGYYIGLDHGQWWRSEMGEALTLMLQLQPLRGRRMDVKCPRRASRPRGRWLRWRARHHTVEAEVEWCPHGYKARLKCERAAHPTPNLCASCHYDVMI